MIRIFISSTWLDLQSERQAVESVLQRIRETKFVGMEYFGSKNETTKCASLQELETCQLYIGIIGKRYGSGITEEEYLRARQLGLSCLIYFKEVATPNCESEEDSQTRERFTLFKNELRRNHIASIFTTPSDLSTKVVVDLHNWLFDKYLVQGIKKLLPDYAIRIQNFISEYLGDLKHPVPFGGRELQMLQLNEWLEDTEASPILLVGADITAIFTPKTLF